MVEIERKGGLLRVDGLPPKDRSLLKGLLVRQDSSRAFRREKGSKRVRYNPNSIRNVRFYSLEKSAIKCRPGWLRQLEDWLDSQGLEYRITPPMEEPLWMRQKWSKADLRQFFDPAFPYVNHQIRALSAMLRNHCGLVKVPTSGGKTDIMIAYLKATRLSAVVVADTVSLVEQTAERFREAGLSAGSWHGTSKDDTRILCSTMHSLKGLNPGDRELFICDETHIAAASSIQKFLGRTSFPFRFGFSATPDSGTALEFAKINQFLGPIIVEVQVGELIQHDVVTPPRIRFLQSHCPRMDNWQDAYDVGIVQNHGRNLTVVDVARNSKNALILFKRIEHGERLKALMPEAELLHGSHSLDERREAVERFKRGDLRFLIASNIFKQGISISNIDTLVNAGAGKSEKETLQKIGRAMRKSEGKYRARIFDFVDRGNKWTREHAEERWNIYKQAGYMDIEEQK